ncbi:methyl-accepting chemotaxis protein [Nitratidesulfovibrio sp. 1201_IL3209]|uniref:methyl-accepting chemotaxis protein n=1 Tax=Nitratidesulfovibrio sp. 1201_IL3209 TaxID=3084053 RepID=UPI002FDB5D77
MRNVRIGTRLVSCFIFVALLSMGLGIAGYVSMREQLAAQTELSDVYLPGIESLAQARFNLRNVTVAHRTLLIPGLTDRARQYKNLADAVTAFKSGIARYEAIEHGASEQAEWHEFLDSLAAFERDMAEAAALIGGWERNPGDTAAHDKAAAFVLGPATERSRVLFKELGDVISVNMASAKAQQQAAAQTASGRRTVISVLMVAVPALALLAGVLLTVSIVRPLRRGVVFASAVAEGRLDTRLDIDQRDEVGQLADSLRTMVDNLKAKIGEAEAATRDAGAEAERARAAMAQAEEATRRAQSARREGMLAAAGQLQGVVEVVGSASEQLSAQIGQSTQGAAVQSQRVAETAAAMEEMNATVLEVARNASQAAETAEHARQKADTGAAVVGRVVEEIGAVERQAVALKDDMADLGRRADGIGKIMNVISDIADQTNLLALNAAIEAARAGDAGRGFAVVADEVRKLAEKTMQATREVGEAITGIQQGTRRNVEHVERAVASIEEATGLAGSSGEALREIVTLVEQATDQVRSIATASEQQSAASEEINRAVDEINRISGETSAGMNESARAVEELATQAHSLRRLIERMQHDEA